MNEVWALIVDRDCYDEMIPHVLSLYSSEKKAEFSLRRYLRLNPDDDGYAYIQKWEVK